LYDVLLRTSNILRSSATPKTALKYIPF
jgi:hypothetical protein